jgi:hypothetical protein
LNAQSFCYFFQAMLRLPSYIRSREGISLL